MAIPTTDQLLVAWSRSFDLQINAIPPIGGLSPAQALAYRPLHDNYAGAVEVLQNARSEGTRSKSLKLARDNAKKALLAYARTLYQLVQANPAVSDADKALLGVLVRTGGGNTPVPRPTVRPGVDLVSVVGRTIEVHIHDSATSGKRAKPAGALAAWVYCFVGEAYPTDASLWQFQGAATNGKLSFTLPDSVPGGAQVYVCAAWVNRKGEAGPVSVPISTNVQGGPVTPATTLRMAA